MQDNRNSSLGLNFNGNGTVCIDTHRVLDCCRDRDCFEGARVYLTECGEEILAAANSVRTKSAKTLCAFVGLEEVPFNCGFFQVKVKYFIALELEACLGLGRSQCFKGLATLEKDVVLYGGDGTVTSFTSSPGTGFCSPCNPDSISTNAPTAIVDTVEPIVLSTRIQDCGCGGCNGCCDCCDVPEVVRNSFDGDFVLNADSPRLLVSFGIFSVIRIVRPTQLLIQATDYSVPDKECCATNNNDNPCELFRTIAFPTARFQARCQTANASDDDDRPTRGCGCGRNG